MKKTRIFKKSEEKFCAVMTYPDNSNVLYYDSAKTKPVLADELVNLFETGSLVVDAGTDGIVRPVLMTKSSSTYTVKVVIGTSTSQKELAFTNGTLS